MRRTLFVLLSFEGPDPYARIGGLSTRVCGLAEGLSGMGYETHLVFVGDPVLPPEETRYNGLLHLHRWSQWISKHHPNGAYDGEAGKVWDWTQSLPGWLADNVMRDHLAGGGNVVVLAEEWQTANVLTELRRVLRKRGWEQQVHLLWNVNDATSLDRVQWEALSDASVITTVSRYMRALLNGYGVEARVVPNGVSAGWLRTPSQAEQQLAAAVFEKRTGLASPESLDKASWMAALGAVAIMKRMGMAPLLVAGGAGRSQEMLREAQQQGLTTSCVACSGPSAAHLIESVRPVRKADVIVLEQRLTPPQRQLLYNAALSVLTNASSEAFGMAGLETMASGGIAMVGCCGEDYATPGHDSISLQTMDPWEAVHNVATLQDSVTRTMSIRKHAKQTAARYTWEAIIQRCLLPTLSMMGVPTSSSDVRTPSQLPYRASKAPSAGIRRRTPAYA